MARIITILIVVSSIQVIVNATTCASPKVIPQSKNNSSSMILSLEETCACLNYYKPTSFTGKEPKIITLTVEEIEIKFDPDTNVPSMSIKPRLCQILGFVNEAPSDKIIHPVTLPAIVTTETNSTESPKNATEAYKSTESPEKATTVSAEPLNNPNNTVTNSTESPEKATTVSAEPLNNPNNTVTNSTESPEKATTVSAEPLNNPNNTVTNSTESPEKATTVSAEPLNNPNNTVTNSTDSPEKATTVSAEPLNNPNNTVTNSTESPEKATTVSAEPLNNPNNTVTNSTESPENATTVSTDPLNNPNNTVTNSTESPEKAITGAADPLNFDVEYVTNSTKSPNGTTNSTRHDKAQSIVSTETPIKTSEVANSTESSHGAIAVTNSTKHDEVVTDSTKLPNDADNIAARKNSSKPTNSHPVETTTTQSVADRVHREKTESAVSSWTIFWIVLVSFLAGILFALLLYAVYTRYKSGSYVVDTPSQQQELRPV